MDLKTYFTAHDGRVNRAGKRMTKAAAECGVKPYYLYMVVMGHKPINAELATKIHMATQGACSRRELCPDFPWDEPTREAA